MKRLRGTYPHSGQHHEPAKMSRNCLENRYTRPVSMISTIANGSAMVITRIASTGTIVSRRSVKFLTSKNRPPRMPRAIRHACLWFPWVKNAARDQRPWIVSPPRIENTMPAIAPEGKVFTRLRIKVSRFSSIVAFMHDQLLFLLDDGLRAAVSTRRARFADTFRGGFFLAGAFPS